MNRAVGWARFGNSGGGHGLLESSGISEDLLQQIRWHTDLPPQSATTWKTFFAGYRRDGYYIIQRTSPDHDADRSGMVETIVLVYTIADLGDMSLAQLKSPVQGAMSHVESVDRCDIPPGVGPGIDLLASAGIVYWIGETSFDRTVESLWDLMNTTDRANLVFGLLFSPTSIPYPYDNRSISIYLVPEGLQSRFDEATTINAEHPPEPGPTARAALSGDITLAEHLGIAEPSLKQWQLLARLQSRLDRMDTLRPAEVRACAHLLGVLTTGADAGLEVKERIEAKLKETSQNSLFADISSCRNLPFDKLPGLTLVDIVSLWSNKVFSTPSHITELGEAIASLEINTTAEFTEFNNALASSLRAECLAIEDNIIEHSYAAVVSDDQRSFSWLADATQSSTIDASLAAKVGPNSAAWLHDAAHRHAMPETHAAACPTGNPITAWGDHLAIDGHTAESRRRLASRCEPKQIVEAALHLGDRHLIGLAGAAVLGTPEAFEPARLDNENWRSVLASAAEQGADPWTWIEACDAVEPVLSAYIDGETGLIPIVAALSAEESVHVLDFPRRAQLWSALDEPHRTLLLKRTARVAALRGDISAAMESPLVKAVCSNGNLRAVSRLNVSAAIDTLATLARHCTAKSAITVAKTVQLHGCSRSLGRIVSANRWKEAALFLSENAAKRADLGPAAEECRHLLSGWKQFKLALITGGRPTSAEVGGGLLDVATGLYPRGPDSGGLWERAGGDSADIPTSGTGRDRWARAIRSVVEGATGAPSMTSLVDAMIDDFKNNRQLKKLRNAL